ncbi:MAG: PGF-pre-PGF domain-containing protein, partial [Methanosarcina sp.]
MKTYFLDYVISLLVVIMLLGGFSPATVYAAEDYDFSNPDIEDPFKDSDKYNKNPAPDPWNIDDREKSRPVWENPESSNLNSNAENKEKENPKSNNNGKSKENPGLTPENDIKKDQNNLEQNTGSKNPEENSNNLPPDKREDTKENSTPNDKNNDKEIPNSNPIDKNKSDPVTKPENKNKENSGSKNQDTQKENKGSNTGSNSGVKSSETPDLDQKNDEIKQNDKINENNKKVNSNSDSNLNSGHNIENKNNDNKKVENPEDKNQIKEIKKNSSPDSGNKDAKNSNSNPESKKTEKSDSDVLEKDKGNTESSKKNQNDEKDKSSLDIENKNIIESKIPQKETINSDPRNVNIVNKYANSKITDKKASNSNNQNVGINSDSGTVTYFDTGNEGNTETATGIAEHADVQHPGDTESLDNKNIENSNNINQNDEFSDLMIEDFFFEPENPEPGENIIFTIIVKNNGPSASPGSELVYTISGAKETESGKIPISSLATGQISIDTFFWTPQTEGIDEVKVEIKSLGEPDSFLSETDETNNKLTKNIIVGENNVLGGQESLENKSSSPESGINSSSGADPESKSSMGSGVPQEPAENIEVKELSTRNVINGYHMRYDFPEEVTCITYIEYDAKKTFKKTTTTVEVLKGQSGLGSDLPAGKIHEYVNIWVGEKGAGLPEALDNGVVGFKVEKTWIEQNSGNTNRNVNENANAEIKNNENKHVKATTDNNSKSTDAPDIILQWYDKEWKPLETKKTGE